TRCIGCGTCVSSCPKHLIQLVPKAQTTITLCAADARCKTSCSECRKEQKIPVVGKKDFKLWRSWCRIFYSSS
ncbi:MAG: 4Fe-4S binding protein, partial [Treponema sp.]|nr:4Fe-4S binding protein [Treponema sp.]